MRLRRGGLGGEWQLGIPAFYEPTSASVTSHTNRLAAREGEIEQGNISIRGLTRGGRSPYSNSSAELQHAQCAGTEQRTGEQFCSSIQLRMDLHAYGQFPFLS